MSAARLPSIPLPMLKIVGPAIAGVTAGRCVLVILPRGDGCWQLAANVRNAITRYSPVDQLLRRDAFRVIVICEQTPGGRYDLVVDASGEIEDDKQLLEHMRQLMPGGQVVRIPSAVALVHEPTTRFA